MRRHRDDPPQMLSFGRKKKKTAHVKDDAPAEAAASLTVQQSPEPVYKKECSPAPEPQVEQLEVEHEPSAERLEVEQDPSVEQLEVEQELSVEQPEVEHDQTADSGSSDSSGDESESSQSESDKSRSHSKSDKSQSSSESDKSQSSSESDESQSRSKSPERQNAPPAQNGPGAYRTSAERYMFTTKARGGYAAPLEPPCMMLRT